MRAHLLRLLFVFCLAWRERLLWPHGRSLASRLQHLLLQFHLPTLCRVLAWRLPCAHAHVLHDLCSLLQPRLTMSLPPSRCNYLSSASKAQHSVSLRLERSHHPHPTGDQPSAMALPLGTEASTNVLNPKKHGAQHRQHEHVTEQLTSRQSSNQSRNLVT